jgi:hypothetical protein
MWSQFPYSQPPWSGPAIPAPPPGQVLPPPIPGGTTSYTVGVQQGAYPWSYGGWAGAIAPYAALVGGVVAVPDSSTGTVVVYCWWPFAPALQVIRVGPDGSRTPVRGAYPIAVSPSATLTNYATNPNSISTAGYVPGTGSPTLSLLTRTDAVGGTAVRATNASAGTSEVTVPQSLPGGQAVTVAVDIQFSARPTSATITLGWNDSLGGALTATTVALTSDQINNSVGQFARQIIQVTPPATAFVCSTLKLNAGGMPASGKMDMDRWLMVQALTDGTYGDGDTLGGLWAGTSGLSTSILSPIQSVVDGECPLDVAATYQVYAPFLTGGSATAPSITLASLEQSWLTHPASPSTPLACLPRGAPVLEHDIDQGIFNVIDRQFPVGISSAVRLAPSLQLELHAQTQVARDALKALLADGSALLLRAPESYGYGLGQWLFIGKVTETRTGAYAWQEGWLMSFSAQQVDSPAGPNTLVA